MFDHRTVRRTRTALLRQALLLVAFLSATVFAACDETPTEPDNQAPTATFSETCTDLSCSFSGSGSSDSDGTIVGYAWEFGDGATGAGAAASHVYAAPGTYEVRLTVTDDDGASSVSARDVTVTAATNQDPVATFTSSCTNLTCAFDASASSDPDGTITGYAWDFGDGATGSGQTVSHTYTTIGTFAVTLTTTDDQGATASDGQSVVLTAPANNVTQLGMTIPGLQANEQMGRSIAMSDDGHRILVGAPHSHAGGSLSGQVRAFEWSGTGWVQLGQSIDGFETSLLLGDDRGITMSGDGNRIALGTPRSGPGSRGSVIVYELAGGMWTPIGQEIIPVATSQFGAAVSLSQDGSRLAVGGPLGPGRAEVYELVGNVWTQLGSSLIGANASDKFGWDVKISADGSRILVSATGASVAGTSGSGKMMVYDWNGSAWAQVGSDINGRQGFGLNIAMSRDGRRVAGYAAVSGDYAAAFEMQGGDWVQMGSEFTISGAFDVYQNLDFSATGDRIVTGAMFGGPNGHGAVSVYDWSGSTWTQVGMDVIGEAQSEHLGWSIAMSADGSRFAAGVQAFNATAPGSLEGGARVFTIN